MKALPTGPQPAILPPQSLEIEVAVLGAIMIDRSAVGQVSDFLDPEHFYNLSHAIIYRAILWLHQDGRPIDIWTVTQRLKDQKKLDECGGAYYISTLTNKTASSAHIQSHARILQQKYIMRTLQTIGHELQNVDESEDVFDIMDKVNERVGKINAITSNGDPVNVAELMAEMVDNREQPTYITMDMGDLDRHVSMGPKCVVVVGARPAVGKTTFIVNAAMNMARNGHPVLIVSLEMSAQQLTAKMMSALTGIDGERITRNEIDESERERIAAAAAYNGSWIPRIYIEDIATLHASQTFGLFERAVKRYGCKVAIIDYLQLMTGDGDNGAERMSNISKACKQAAKASGIRLVELSQLKRRDGADTKPEMSDLRESGQIEADGDIIILLGREQGSEMLDVNIAKNKIGPVGHVKVPFALSSQRVGNLSMPTTPHPDDRIEPAPF